MKRFAVLGAMLLALSTATAQAAEEVTIQLKWVTQAQFVS